MHVHNNQPKKVSMDGSGNWTIDIQFTESESEMMSNFTSIAFTENGTIYELNLTCEQIQEEVGMPLQLPMDAANVLRYIQGAYYIASFPIGVFLNLFVILLISYFKSLQNITYILALQVSVGDLLNAVTFFPTSAANAIAGRYVFTGLCSTIGFILFYLSLVRIYLMFVLVLDRFCTVFMPFWYQRHRVKVVLPISVGAWILAFVIALVPVKGLLSCYSVLRNTWGCYPLQGCIYQRECFTYNFISIALTNICSVVSIILYLSLFCKARKLRNQIAIAHQPSDADSKETRAATARKLKRDRRANVTFFLLFLALMGVSFPPLIFLLIGRAITVVGGTTPPTAYTVAEILAGSTFPLLIVIDPVVITRNDDFRGAIRKLLNKLKIKLVSRAVEGSERNGTMTGTTNT